MLDALDASPRAGNTIVVFFGDHGWHFGEKDHWRKFALWEEATRAPFIWVVPGVTKAGGVCARPVDFMTIYPTLCDLAGIEPAGKLEGTSIRTLLADPTSETEGVAVTTHGYQNHAVRTARWRYIRYADGKPWPTAVVGRRLSPVSSRLLTQPIKGSPAWMKSDHYSIAAKADGAPGEEVTQC